jgi:FixJ family two-component response regulator
VTNSQIFVAVVDDEPAVLVALERLLRSAGFEVTTFLSGAAFLASMATRRPDCLILDLHMPGMNGFDVLAQLSADPLSRMGVIAITAHDTVSSQQRVVKGGATYLRKPIDGPTLVEAIRAAVAPSATP